MASTVAHPDERNPDRARHFAFAAAALLFASLFTPWWSVSHISADAPQFHMGHRVDLFEDGSGVAVDDATLATGLLTAIALAWVAWGLLAQSWRFEPGKWRRDILSGLVFVAVAVISLAWWPVADGTVFGAFDVVGHDGSEGAVELDASPGIGAVFAVAAGISLAVAAYESMKKS